jgi:hypothetical protein
MDIHKYNARVTRTRFGKWIIVSIFSDDTLTEMFFRTPGVDMKKKSFMFGLYRMPARQIARVIITGSDDVTAEPADGRIPFAVFNENTRRFIKKMETIGVRNGKEYMGGLT